MDLQEKKTGRSSTLPPQVVSRAKSAGAVGEKWLSDLDDLVSSLEKKWNITVGKTLWGGSHAFVAEAQGEKGEQYVVKLEMPEEYGGDYSNGITTLQLAQGKGFAKLFAYEPKLQACLLERLGKPVNQLGYSVWQQLEVICDALRETWQLSLSGVSLPTDTDCVDWFRGFIPEIWEKLQRPCSHQVVKQALAYLDAREKAFSPAAYVLLHGDAHGGNTLQTLDGKGYKLIDPDGIFYEKAYDLGVLMREWTDTYEKDPIAEGKKRCVYLHELTDVPEEAIWQWGYLQTVSTGLLATQSGMPAGKAMLKVAESWAKIQ
jgi:streptomycin 6-kinase